MSEQKMDRTLLMFNGSDKPATFYVEPWGEEMVVPPKEYCRVLYSLGTEEQTIEIEYIDGGVALHFTGGALGEFAWGDDERQRG